MPRFDERVAANRADVEEGRQRPADRDVLRDDPHRRTLPDVVLRRGLVVEVAGDGFVGTVTGADATTVELTDRRGRRRRFQRHPGAFLVDDRPVNLVLPSRPQAPKAPPVSNSGSVAVPAAPARVARASRIMVEGVHDAVLLEQVWGHDLRVEGVVVEVLDGADDLQQVVSAFAPGPGRRLGILLDHLVPGSKETRLAATVRHPQVLVTGHPYVDVWQAIRPEALDIDAWPAVPYGEEWKTGAARRLGFADADALWRHARNRVTTWRDLEQPLIAAVESLIDFVTGPDRDRSA